MNIQDRIWSDLTTSDYQAIYASIHNSRVRKLSDGINILTAAVSSASVGAWAIWEHLPGVWGFLIAISQFINLAKPYIPRIRDYELYHELQLHYKERHYELDDLWLQISLGDLSEEEIKNAYRSIYQKFFNLSKKFLKVRVENNKKIEKLAISEWELSLAKYGASDN
jgi:hypothetical protein